MKELGKRGRLAAKTAAVLLALALVPATGIAFVAGMLIGNPTADIATTVGCLMLMVAGPICLIGAMTQFWAFATSAEVSQLRNALLLIIVGAASYATAFVLIP